MQRLNLPRGSRANRRRVKPPLGPALCALASCLVAVLATDPARQPVLQQRAFVLAAEWNGLEAGPVVPVKAAVARRAATIVGNGSAPQMSRAWSSDLLAR